MLKEISRYMYLVLFHVIIHWFFESELLGRSTSVFGAMSDGTTILNNSILIHETSF